MAAAFGAPLGGTLFSLEEVASFWSTLLTWRTFFTCMIAVFLTKLFNTIKAGDHSIGGLMIFDVGPTAGSQKYEVWELFPFLVVGVIGGLLGAAFTALNLWVSQIRVAKINKKTKWRVLEVVAIAAVSSCLQYLLPFMSACEYVVPSPPDENKTKEMETRRE